MIRKIIIILSAIIELATLHVWFVCQRFTDIFHNSSIDIAFQLGTYMNAFKGKPLWFARLFHNKLIQMPINFLRFYLQFWDVRFGSSWFSLIGYFGIFAGFYYIVGNKKKRIYHWLALIIIVLLPCIEIIFAPKISLPLKSIYLWLPFIGFSLYGIYQFLSHGNLKKRVLFVSILLVISFFWIFFLPYDISRYCIHFPQHLKIKK